MLIYASSMKMKWLDTIFFHQKKDDWYLGNYLKIDKKCFTIQQKMRKPKSCVKVDSLNALKC